MPNLLCTVTKITVNWAPPPKEGGGGPASTQGVPCYVFIFAVGLKLLSVLASFFPVTDFFLLFRVS